MLSAPLNHFRFGHQTFTPLIGSQNVGSSIGANSMVNHYKFFKGPPGLDWKVKNSLLT